VGVFGEDDPDTPAREIVGFTVQIDREAKFVGLGIVDGPHGTMVAGTAAGRGFFGGAFDGVAPGAQIVSMRSGSNSYEHELIEAIILACRHPAVDIVSVTAGTEAWLEGERDIRDLLVNRLVSRYRKSIVVAADNSGPAMSTVGNPSIASGAIS